MPLTITFVRHGQTTRNQEKKIQTRTDAPLSELGKLQAEALGKRLAEEKFTRIYASDLSRTGHTAELVLKYNTRTSDHNIVRDKRLRERNFGDWENECVTAISNHAKELGVRFHQLEPPNGESYKDFAPKGLEFFKDLCQLTDGLGCSENILVVTHGGWILTLVDSLKKPKEVFVVEDLQVDESLRNPKNTSTTKLSVESLSHSDNAKYKVKFLEIFNDDHLRGDPFE